VRKNLVKDLKKSTTEKGVKKIVKEAKKYAKKEIVKAAKDLKKANHLVKKNTSTQNKRD